MRHHSDHGLLIINYHYIREMDQYPYPGIHPLEPQAFKAQVKWLKDRYHMATPHEVEHFYYGGKTLAGPSILLTFDDGLVEHGTLVEEVLRPLQIKAVFFISSRPLLESRASMVHKIHWLRASSPPEVFRKEFFSLLPDKMPPAKTGDGIREKALRTYPYDTPENAKLKYLINFQLPHDTVDSITSIMVEDRGILEHEFCEKFYMPPSQVRILHEAGHMIGCHGHSHAPFSVLKKNALEMELKTSTDYFEGLLGRKPSWVSYPFRTRWSIPADIEEVCRKFDLTIGCCLDKDQKRWNRGKESPYRIDRVNTNHVKELCSAAR